MLSIRVVSIFNIAAHILNYYGCLTGAAALPDTNGLSIVNNTNNQGIDGSRNIVGTTRWPPAPFEVPNGLGPELDGYLRFNTIGQGGAPSQLIAFTALSDLIRSLPGSILFRDSVAVVEKVPATGGSLEAFFFDMRLVGNGKLPKHVSPPKQGDACYMLETLNSQVQEHGLAELQTDLEKHPIYDGGIQILLEPTISIPRSDVIYLYVSSLDQVGKNNITNDNAYNGTNTTSIQEQDPPMQKRHIMVTILQYHRRSDSISLLSNLLDCNVAIGRRDPKAIFKALDLTTHNYRFNMYPTGDSGLEPMTLKNAEAKAIVATLFSFEQSLVSTLKFNVRMLDPNAGSTSKPASKMIAKGTLQPRLGNGNATLGGGEGGIDIFAVPVNDTARSHLALNSASADVTFS